VGSTRAPIDLLAVAVLALVGALAAWVDAPLLLQLPLALPLVLLLPGYAIGAITHPGIGVDEPGRKPIRALATADRLILSVVLSLAASILTGIVLNFTPLGLTVQTTSAALAGLAILAAALALVVRLADTPADRRPSFGWTWRTPSWHEGLSLVALAAALIVLATAGTVFMRGVRDEGYVALFVEPNYVDECYPLQYVNATYVHNPEGGTKCPAGPAELWLVINNHQAYAIDYTVRLEWSREPGPDLPGERVARESTGRLEPLPREDYGEANTTLERQHTELLDPGPPPFEGLQYLKVHLFIGEDDGTPEQALQLRVQA
jgi:hypothetical protein